MDDIIAELSGLSMDRRNGFTKLQMVTHIEPMNQEQLLLHCLASSLPHFSCSVSQHFVGDIITDRNYQYFLVEINIIKTHEGRVGGG